MGVGLRFGVGPLRFYVPLSGGRKRKRRSSGRSSTPSWHAKVKLPDGSDYKCHHNHRTEQAATECADKYIRANFPQARSSTYPRKAAPMPRKNAGSQLGRPPQWWPRAGWGTMRGFARNHEGFRFYWVPDDGSQPRLFELPGVPATGLGEYARGVMQGNDFSIQVTPEIMAEAKQRFEMINRLDLPDRKEMFAVANDLAGDAGWTWAPDYTVMPVAPGLIN
jgi:hypothetical protein